MGVGAAGTACSCGANAESWSTSLRRSPTSSHSASKARLRRMKSAFACQLMAASSRFVIVHLGLRSRLRFAFGLHARRARAPELRSEARALRDGARDVVERYLDARGQDEEVRVRLGAVGDGLVAPRLHELRRVAEPQLVRRLDDAE